MPTSVVNGVRLYYEVHGDAGEPLVFVHGYTGDITDWKFQIAEFSRDYRVLIMDLRGHGRSEAPADRSAYTIPAMSGDVEALVDEAGFAKYHLVGHSMGGAIVQEMALHSPQRLLSLTLEDTAPILHMPGNAAMEEWNNKQISVAENEGMAAVAALYRASPLPLPVPPDLEEMSNRRLAKMSVDGFIGATLAGPKWQGTVERAPAISTPTLVIHGTLDFPPIVLGCQWLAQLIPHAKVEAIPEAGHSPQWEQPDVYNRALRQHLEANRAGSRV
jgi:pimeloyl-ACP methyl ester carboxylesterase